MKDSQFEDPIVEIVEVVSEESANVYLKDKWILLETGFAIIDSTPSFLYSLGLPQSVKRQRLMNEEYEVNMRRIMKDE
ncbi:hypothetical protein ACHHV8_33705 [Paenibacillus sp. TAB 01]|uniref:hypothetical protein n=1 Tax=Paenibacillus sp. TAB 01 TaxID=3368988 RepID=UPI0037536A14